jgi:molybdopterin biosynthesis enzyme
MSALVPVAEALGEALASLTPPAPVAMAVNEALGKVVAEDIPAPGARPTHMVALRQGFAVESLATVGASPESPVLLARAPVAVAIDDALPDHCDAVLPRDAVCATGSRFEIIQVVAPGEGVRRIGHDLAEGEVIARGGATMSPSLQLVLQAAGFETVPIIAPRIAIAAGPPAAEAWLGRMIATLGCVPANCHDTDIVIAWTGSADPRLALRPGDTAMIAPTGGGRVTVTLPERFDGLIAGFVALVLPAIAVLSRRQIRLEKRPLRQKIASVIGTTDCVLLQSTQRGYVPLATGEITLAALAGADAFTLVPPESEGMPAGQPIAATPFDAMLEEQEKP